MAQGDSRHCSATPASRTLRRRKGNLLGDAAAHLGQRAAEVHQARPTYNFYENER